MCPGVLNRYPYHHHRVDNSCSMSHKDAWDPPPYPKMVWTMVAVIKTALRGVVAGFSSKFSYTELRPNHRRSALSKRPRTVKCLSNKTFRSIVEELLNVTGISFEQQLQFFRSTWALPGEEPIQSRTDHSNQPHLNGQFPMGTNYSEILLPTGQRRC